MRCGAIGVLVLLAAAGGAMACGYVGASTRERAHEAWVDGDFEAAAADYEKYLASGQAEPEAEEASYRLADIYYLNLKRYEQARDWYLLSLERYPASGLAYQGRIRLAEVYVEIGGLPDAIAHYEQVLVEHPHTSEDRKIRAAVADLYFRHNDHDQAEIEYGRVVENAPYDDLTERSLLRLASISHLVRNDEARSIPLFERVAQATGDPAVRRTALYGISDSYANLFRFDEAIATLGRVDDPAEAEYVAKRVAELEKQKRKHADAPEIDWGRGKAD